MIFGPNSVKRYAKPYRSRKGTVITVRAGKTNSDPYASAIIANPSSCIGLRPILSIVRAAIIYPGKAATMKMSNVYNIVALVVAFASNSLITIGVETVVP